eukprot:136722-Pelagomonas_calceolata.AAC.1
MREPGRCIGKRARTIHLNICHCFQQWKPPAHSELDCTEGRGGGSPFPPNENLSIQPIHSRADQSKPKPPKPAHLGDDLQLTTAHSCAGLGCHSVALDPPARRRHAG